MESDYYSELVGYWNNTLNVIAELAGVPVALVMKLADEDISVFCKNDNIDNPYQLNLAEPIKNSGLLL